MFSRATLTLIALFISQSLYHAQAQNEVRTSSPEEYRFVWTGEGTWLTPDGRNICNGYIGGSNPGNWVLDGTENESNPWEGQNHPTSIAEWESIWSHSFSTMIFNNANSKHSAYVFLERLSLGGLEVSSRSSSGLAYSILASSSAPQFLYIGSNSKSEVLFDIQADFNLGSSAKNFEAAVIQSDWRINVGSNANFNLYAPLTGGAGKKITFSGGGTTTLFNSSVNLESDIYLKDNSTIAFSANGNYTSSSVLGTGTIYSSGGIIKFIGDSSTSFTNNLVIAEGGYFITDEAVRNFSGHEEFYNYAVFMEMSGNISGSGNYIRKSSGGKYATNAAWIFTGDNSNFSGNWYIGADVDYNSLDSSTGIKGDKPYSFIPTSFGDGSAYTGKGDFSSIAGTGAIYGTSSQSSRGGAVLGFNYSTDVTIINDLRGSLRIRHMSDAVLTLAGNNTHYFGTYAENGGTIRFTEAKNLGDTTGTTVLDEQGNPTIELSRPGGAIIALNNDSTIDYAGSGSCTINNALFNDTGSWTIKTSSATGILNWDLSQRGVYKTSPLDVESFRTGEFFKTGAGTLNITAGSLLTAANTVNIKEGTLQFSGTGSWGAANRIVMSSNTTLKQITSIINNGLTLSTAPAKNITQWNGATIDGNLTLDGGTLEFQIVAGTDRTGEAQHYTITGDFSIGENGATFNFVQNEGANFEDAGYYLLFTAGNDMSSFDWKAYIESGLLTLTGLPDPATSRQTFTLHTGGTYWNGNYVPGNVNEVYIHATPSAARLTWNLATGGNWTAGAGADDWTGHDSDNRYYQGDTVVFSDNISVGDKTITLTGEVKPAAIIVEGKSNYTFVSEAGKDYGISGQTNILKTGSGTLTINTSNSYTGGTIISDGTLIANAANALGTGEILLERKEHSSGRPTLIANAENALGNNAITINDGHLIINASNEGVQKITLNKGVIDANATNSFNGTLVAVNDGSIVNLNAESAVGLATINIRHGGIVYANNTNALSSNKDTVVNIYSGGVVSASAGTTTAFGNGTINLYEDGVLEFYTGDAAKNLKEVYVDGGILRFHGIINLEEMKNFTLSAKQQIIYDVVGAGSVLTIDTNQSTSDLTTIIKRGEGAMGKTLSDSFRRHLVIEQGIFFLTQAKGNSHTMFGSVEGQGTLVLNGGGDHRINSDLHDFTGKLIVDMENASNSVYLDGNNDNRFRKTYDVTLNLGTIKLGDSHSTNNQLWGNLNSGSSANTADSIIKVCEEVDLEDIQANGRHTISISQSIDGEFSGRFMNGGANNDVEIDVYKKAFGTLILSNDNTNTGTLFIEQGTIQLGNGGDKGNWAGDIVNDSILSLLYGDVEKEISSDISGSGRVDIETEGTVIISGGNTYSGGTNIKGGTVKLEGDGTLGTGDITMSGQSSLDATNAIESAFKNQNLIVQNSSQASIKNINLEHNTTVKTENGSFTLQHGTADIIINTLNEKKTKVSGKIVSGKLSINASDIVVSLEDVILSGDSTANTTGGTASISNTLTIQYNGNSTNVNNKGGSMETDAIFTQTEGGSYSVTDLTMISLDFDNVFMELVDDQTRIVLNIFDLGIDPSNMSDEEILIILSQNMIDAGWRVAAESLKNGWLSNGNIVLVRPIPEPTSATLSLLALALIAARRRRKA